MASRQFALKKLKTLLNTVGLLDDAEAIQVFSPAVKSWLDDLRDAAYKVDVLLDLIAYEFAASKIEADQQITTGYQCYQDGDARNDLSNKEVKKAKPMDV